MLLSLHLRQIDLLKSRPVSRGLAAALRHAESEKSCAILRETRLEARGALLAYAIQRGWPHWAAARLRRAIEAVEPGRDEILTYRRATALAAHAHYYRPADEFFALMSRAHDSARALGREDLLLAGAGDFCRVV